MFFPCVDSDFSGGDSDDSMVVEERSWVQPIRGKRRPRKRRRDGSRPAPTTAENYLAAEAKGKVWVPTTKRKKAPLQTAMTEEESVLHPLWTQQESNALTHMYRGPTTPVDSNHICFPVFSQMKFGICW